MLIIGLIRYQTFKKREATTKDLILILSTLWMRGKDIRFSPRLRAAFYVAVLLYSILGLYIGEAMQIKYR